MKLWVIETVRDYTQRIALGLQIKGLLNIQMAVKDDLVYVLEVNPRKMLDTKRWKEAGFKVKVIGVGH